MDIAAVRQGLADAADTIAGLNCFGYTPDSIPEPCFCVGEVIVDFDQTMSRGMDELVVTCLLLVSRADDRAGQAKLDGYLAGSGALSVKAALEAARGAPGQLALGGACDDIHVMRIQGYGLHALGDATYYGAKFMVRAIGSGS